MSVLRWPMCNHSCWNAGWWVRQCSRAGYLMIGLHHLQQAHTTAARHKTSLCQGRTLRCVRTSMTGPANASSTSHTTSSMGSCRAPSRFWYSTRGGDTENSNPSRRMFSAPQPASASDRHQLPALIKSVRHFPWIACLCMCRQLPLSAAADRRLGPSDWSAVCGRHTELSAVLARSRQKVAMDMAGRTQASRPGLTPQTAKLKTASYGRCSCGTHQ